MDSQCRLNVPQWLQCCAISARPAVKEHFPRASDLSRRARPATSLGLTRRDSDGSIPYQRTAPLPLSPLLCGSAGQFTTVTVTVVVNPARRMQHPLRPPSPGGGGGRLRYAKLQARPARNEPVIPGRSCEPWPAVRGTARAAAYSVAAHVAIDRPVAGLGLPAGPPTHDQQRPGLDT